jgi:hypothetical protein
MTEPRILEPTILDAIERYFELLQGHASAQEMTERVLTDEEFNGQAFHTWRLRRQPPNNDWRVAAQMVDGFAMLNDNAAALFAAPTEGLHT